MFANMFYIVKQTSEGEMLVGRGLGATNLLGGGQLGGAKEALKLSHRCCLTLKALKTVYTSQIIIPLAIRWLEDIYIYIHIHTKYIISTNIKLILEIREKNI